MIYVYFGQDYGQVVHNCFKDLEKISKDVEIVKFDGFNNYVQDIISECTSYSLFDQKKIVIFEHAYFLTSTKVKSTISESKQNYKALQDFITSNEGYDLILLVPGLLDSKNTVVSLLKDNNCILNEAKSMTKEDYIEYGIKIAKDNNKEKLIIKMKVTFFILQMN